MSSIRDFFSQGINALTTSTKSCTEDSANNAIEKICSQIKSIGRLPIDSNDLENKMYGVLKFMKQYPSELQVQWSGCHAISNVSMNINAATMLMEQDAHNQVLNAIQTFGKDDWKICWLGCSAIWNLARPPSYRFKFTNECLETMLGVLFQYTYVPKVVNTALGAISNLALQTEYKNIVASYVDSILPIINQYSDESHICATAGGLLANLAVSDEVAEVLVNKGALYSIAEMWKHNITDENFQRNTVAVLSNCLTADCFIDEMLRYDLIEKLFQIHTHSTNVSVNTLVVNCFQVLQVDADFKTTSLHMCCHHGKYNLLKQKMMTVTNVEHLINAKDGRNAPMLLYAAAGDHLDIVKYLIKCGSNCSYLLEEKTISLELRTVILEALKKVDHIRRGYNLVIDQATKEYHVPSDISLVIGEYLHPFDMFAALGSL